MKLVVDKCGDTDGANRDDENADVVNMLVWEVVFVI